MSALPGAIVRQLLGPLQPQIGPLPGVLLDQVRSPLELAVPTPYRRRWSVALTSCSWYSYMAPTETAANALLRALAQVEPDLQLGRDASGSAWSWALCK